VILKPSSEFTTKIREHGFKFQGAKVTADAIKLDSIYEAHNFSIGYKAADHCGSTREAMDKGEFRNRVHWSTGYESQAIAMDNAKSFKNDDFIKKHDEWRRTNPGIAESMSISPKRRLVRGDNGSELDAQKFLAGKFDTMWSKRQKVKEMRRNHRIVMMLGGACFVEPEQMNLTAIAAMEIMLNIGPKAEFVLVCGNQSAGVHKNMFFDILAKKSGASLCRSTASYAASVMMFRLTVFTLLECLEGIPYGLGQVMSEDLHMDYISAHYKGSTVVPFIRDDKQLKQFLSDFREGKLKPV
jgi:hypothetical protein